MPLTKRILSIDDQASICQMIQFTMSDLSDDQVEYEVDVASDGASGLAMAKKKQYDLIITDQKMPGDVDGLTVIRTLKSMPEYRNTPIVMLTMETTEAMKNAARSVGATGWMNKPFTPVSLITMVQKVLR
jgi:two-component system chemotaxis response regulator CheY